ncbi:MAG: mercury resistance system transport protein MerF [Thermodesulfovibrionia bacterium]|nr:mercury resistance system transport protein MerF [Thermodesulfovibrionia bacterium]MCK5511165.1 mercury resistance system transport protein MerF [Thermodesulfovibrionia bacterium]
MTTLVGTVVVAVCCFTPILVSALSVIGLGILVPYLDFILFPALGLLILITIVSYLQWKKSIVIEK